MRGTAFGFFSSSIGVISLPMPYIGTLLWQNFGPKVPFYVPLVALLVMLPIIWVKFRLPKTDPPSPPDGLVVTESAAPNG